MRVFYPVWQVTELAAGYRYTTRFFELPTKAFLLIDDGDATAHAG